MRGFLRRSTMVAAAVVLAGLVIRAVPDTPPESDHAVTEIRVLNVLRGTETLGPYSRFGWNHPGPLYFQLLAPLYLASGYRHLGVIVSAAAINTACLIGLVALLGRRRAAPGVLPTAVVLFGLYLTRLHGLLASSWNPHIGILPLALLVVCAAGAASGTPWLLTAVVGLASFVIQTHVGNAAASIAIVIAALMLTWLDRRGGKDRASARTSSLVGPLSAAAGVGLLLWIVPLVDELRPAGAHNLQQLAGFFQSHAPTDTRAATHAFERFLVAPFTPHLVLWGETPASVREWLPLRLAPVQGALLVIAALVWRARGRRFEARLSVVLVAASLAAWLSVRRLPEYPKDYTILWVSVLGVMSWTVILALVADPVVQWIARQSELARRVFERWLPSAAVLLIVVSAAWQIEARREAEAQQPSTAAELTRIVRARLGDFGTETPLIHIPPADWGTVAGVVLQLYRGGARPVVDADWVSMFGRAFTPNGREPVTFAFGRPQEYEEDLRFRSNYRMLGRGGDIDAYSVEPPPALQPIAGPLDVVASADLVGDPRALLDGSNGSIAFLGARSFVTIAVPEGIAGLRLTGDRSETWQLHCLHEGRPTPAGRLTTTDGPGPQIADAYMRGLSRCGLLTIAPAAVAESQRLSRIELLVAR